MKEPLDPIDVIPPALAKVIKDSTYWFVIGGHAVRCLCPYRPSHDVDFGVKSPKNARELLGELSKSGTVEVLEKAAGTTHLHWNDINVSIFVLPKLSKHVEQRRLTVDGILATKTHAILDRGTRRDFFDLYVMLQDQRLGIIECLRALSDVYETSVDDGLILRAFSYFDDAESEAPLPGEGPSDFAIVKKFFRDAVAALIMPPTKILRIQRHRVDVCEPTRPKSKIQTHRPRKRPRKRMK